MRVDFRQNRGERARSDDWTRRFHADEDQLADAQRGEQVRAKGAMSRRRTIMVDDQNLPVIDPAQQVRGLVTRVHGLLSYVVDLEGRAWECSVRRVLRTLLIEQRSSVVVGDRVWFSDLSAYHDGAAVGVIDRVDERSSVLSRRVQRRREHAIVANADQLLGVFAVAQPRLKPHLVDRYIIAAERGGLRPVLCFNKVDLLDESAFADVEELAAAEGEFVDEQAAVTVGDAIAEFQRLGYHCVLTSATDDVGVDELRDALRDKITVVSGQSGVGKSSLINAVQPGLRLATKEVSAESEKGRHTTTLAELHPLAFGGYVVDTPGIRGFDLWSVASGELEAYFVEIAPLVAQCRFANCTHLVEDDCAVRSAVAQGAISVRRYLSYAKLYEEM